MKIIYIYNLIYFKVVILFKFFFIFSFHIFTFSLCNTYNIGIYVHDRAYIIIYTCNHDKHITNTSELTTQLKNGTLCLMQRSSNNVRAALLSSMTGPPSALFPSFANRFCEPCTVF